MAAPMMVEFPAEVTASQILDVVSSLGITATPCGDGGGRRGWICLRGRARFHLAVNLLDGRSLAWISADVSDWRWWNFPVVWLMSFRDAGQSYRLEWEAYRALRPMGISGNYDEETQVDELDDVP